MPLDRARVRRDRTTKQDTSGLQCRFGCPVCNVIKDGKREQAHSDQCRSNIEASLEATPPGAERPDRLSDVIKRSVGNILGEVLEERARYG